MSEHPTERFERPVMPPDAPPSDPTEALPYHPPAASPEPPPATPTYQPPATPTYEPSEPPPAAPTYEPLFDPPHPDAPPADETADRSRVMPVTEPEQRQSVAAGIAQQWFSQPDNVLMAITALVAVLFLVLVAILG